MELLHTVHVPVGHGPIPSVIAVHGWGANAHDLLGLAPYLHAGHALVVCPEGPLERGQSSRDALLKLGVPTSYHEYPMGHELSAETLRELVEWLETKLLGPVLRI